MKMITENITKLTKLLADGRKRAVFVINDKIRIILADGKQFNSMVVDYPREFVGVYSENATRQMIREDLECYK